MGEGKIKIRQIRSTAGVPDKLRNVVWGLGLGKINKVVEKPDNPAIRGMVAKVSHLVVIEPDH